jgi:hypothetical protein
MAKPPLLKAQGRDLAKVIEHLGFDREAFEIRSGEWDPTRDDPYNENVGTVLGYKETPYYFMFVEVSPEQRGRLNSGGAFVARWSPGEEVVEKTDYGLEWGGVLGDVQLWLNALKYEVTGPDVWAELADVHAEHVSRPNDPLTSSEQQLLDVRLDELLAYAHANYDLAADAVTELQAAVAYLKHAARRLPRIDWANAAVGAVMGWLLGVALPPDAARTIMSRLVDIVHAVTGVLRLLPPG